MYFQVNSNAIHLCGQVKNLRIMQFFRQVGKYKRNFGNYLYFFAFPKANVLIY